MSSPLPRVLSRNRRVEVAWWAASALLAIAGIAYVLRRGDLRDSLLALRAVDGWLMSASILAAAAALGVRAIRWHVLMRTPQAPPFAEVLLGLLAGQTINAVAPLRVGDLARPYLLGGDTSRMYALATIVVEKWIDLFVVVTLSVILLVTGAVPALSWSAVSRGVALLAVGIAVVVAFAAAVGTLRHRAPWLSRGAMIRRTLVELEAVPSRLQALRDRAKLGSVLFLTVAVWACTYASVWTALRAVSGTIPDVGVLTVLVLQYLGSPIPSPARLGTHQAITVAGLSLFHVPGQTALTAAIVLYLSVVFIPLLVGAGALWLIVHRFGAGRLLRSSERDLQRGAEAPTH